ncbi:MAG TPA: hypothetical protein VNJ04_18505 [Gemmatimonadaceae bacterium]|nr:hypothetical protein [Gemmatimonadaceae bacterium]
MVQQHPPHVRAAAAHPVAARLYRDSYLAHLRERFMRDSNPLWIWIAYRVVRSGRASTVDREASVEETFTLPLWIAAYFDVVAEALLGGEKPDDALGFAGQRGGTSKLRQVKNAERNVWIFAAVDSYMAAESPDEVEPEAAGWLFPSSKSRGDLKIALVCDHVAELFFKQGHGRRDKKGILRPFKSDYVKNIYFALRPSDE